MGSAFRQYEASTVKYGQFNGDVPAIQWACCIIHAPCSTPQQAKFFTGPSGFAELYGKPSQAKLSTYVNNSNADMIWQKTEACINLLQMVPRES